MYVYDRFKRYSVRIFVFINKVFKKGSLIFNFICFLINLCCEYFRLDIKLKKGCSFIIWVCRNWKIKKTVEYNIFGIICYWLNYNGCFK